MFRATCETHDGDFMECIECDNFKQLFSAVLKDIRTYTNYNDQMLHWNICLDGAQRYKVSVDNCGYIYLKRYGVRPRYMTIGKTTVR